MHLGNYFGIPLRVNPFFFLLLLLSFYFGKFGEVLILFAIVLWHELFHVLTARFYRLDVVEIELLPFGGVARLEALLQLNPEIEWIVAIVGPLSNLLMIGIGYALLPYLTVPPAWFEFFYQANLGMAVFNLLPALPLDGGRILRSILVARKGFLEATKFAAISGRIIAVVLVLISVYGLYLGYYNALLFICVGLLLYWTAWQEEKNASYILMRYLTRKKQQLRLKRVLQTRELVATVETSIGEVLRHFRPPNYHLIWVIDLEGNILGFFGELELIQAFFEEGLHCKIEFLVKYKV